jgi:hypothetical protein
MPGRAFTSHNSSNTMCVTVLQLRPLDAGFFQERLAFLERFPLRPSTSFFVIRIGAEH